MIVENAPESIYCNNAVVKIDTTAVGAQAMRGTKRHTQSPSHASPVRGRRRGRPPHRSCAGGPPEDVEASGRRSVMTTTMIGLVNSQYVLYAMIFADDNVAIFPKTSHHLDDVVDLTATAAV